QMPPSCQVTAITCANEFSEHFVVDHGTLMCLFCDTPINFEIKLTITTHINSAKHIANKSAKGQYEKRSRNLVEAFISANILLEKVDKLCLWLQNNFINGGSIPLAEALRQNFLKPVYNRHMATMKSEFVEKP
ncbi:1282_t:CDS:2, partial [Gigaspora margarita]